MTEPTNPRFSEKRFRSLENAISTVVKQWPKPVLIEGLPHVSRFTLATYLRDAITSLRNNQWETIVPMAQFLQICDEIKVIVVSSKTLGEQVLAGEERLLRERPYSETRATVSVNASLLSEEGLRVDNPNDFILSALLLLHSARILTHPTTVFNTNHSNAMLDQFKTLHDVEIERLSPTSFLII